MDVFRDSSSAQTILKRSKNSDWMSRNSEVIFMKREFITSEAKFVFSKDELGYQEVLDDMSVADEITIITYNISERSAALVNGLRSVGQHCKVNVITNIPSRWETYYGDTFRDKAREKINLYMNKLNPEKLGIMPSVFFDFSNHGKIIMTNNIVYVGSANYSEESAKNTEFGFISRDRGFIDFIHDEVLPEIKASSFPYYAYDYTSLLLEANIALSSLFNIKNRLYEEAYRLHDDIDGEWYYYNEHEAFLNQKTLELVVQIVSEATHVASDIYDAIDVITGSDDNELDVANDLYDTLCDMHQLIEDISSRDSLYELARFDTEGFINEQLNEEYAMEAYEENLEKCIESASGEASSIVFDLTTAAHGDIDELIAELDKFIKQYSDFINSLRGRPIKKINPEINNT